MARNAEFLHSPTDASNHAAATAVENPLTILTPSETVDVPSPRLILASYTSSNIPKWVFEQCFQLIWHNLSQYYNKSDEDNKRREMREPAGRYIILFDQNPVLIRDSNICPVLVSDGHERGDSDEHSGEKSLTVAGFVYFQISTEFSYDEQDIAESQKDTVIGKDKDGNTLVAVSYCYEIQIHPAFQRKNLGRFLMDILRRISIATRMRKIVLTVFTSNKSAISFYRRLGFEEDAISPGQCADPDEVSEDGFDNDSDDDLDNDSENADGNNKDYMIMSFRTDCESGPWYH